MLKTKSLTGLLLALLLFPSLNYAQASKDGTKAHYQRMYLHAVQYNDLSVATNAVYGMLALAPGSVGLRDTLAQLYFQRGAWPQVVFITDELYQNDPENLRALELRAIAKQTLGMIKESLADYEILYGKSKSPFHLYELATLQYQMRRHGECQQSVTQLLNDPKAIEEEINISMPDGASQKVPMKAACMNLMGVLELDQGKKKEAIAQFEGAIEVFPDFVLAKNNLETAKNGGKK